MTEFAFVFPGQGSQSPGMLADMAQDNPIIQSTFAEASEALGYDLWDLVQNDDSGKLNSTEVTQPALLTAGVALYRLWLEKGNAKPSVMAGHSLGEYTALCCAGVVTLADAVKLVEARGRFMQEAVPEGVGKMAAILKLDDAVIEQVCNDLSAKGVVAPVNYNSPGQVVIAGETALVEEACELLKEKGGRAMPLAVSVPSHCALMKPAAEKLLPLLNDVALSSPEIPVINNVDVKIENDVEAIKHALERQLYCPVRWTETGGQLAQQGATQMFECGPGKVISGLMKRIDKTLTCQPLGTAADFEKALDAL